MPTAYFLVELNGSTKPDVLHIGLSNAKQLIFDLPGNDALVHVNAVSSRDLSNAAIALGAVAGVKSLAVVAVRASGT